MRYVGIDLGKKTCSVTLVNEKGKAVGQLEIENAKPSWAKLGHLLKPGDRPPKPSSGDRQDGLRPPPGRRGSACNRGRRWPQ